MNVNGVVEEIADYGGVDTVTVWETPDMQWEELCEDELIDLNKESGCDGKDEDSSKKVIKAENFTLKELLEVFHDIAKG